MIIIQELHQLLEEAYHYKIKKTSTKSSHSGTFNVSHFQNFDSGCVFLHSADSKNMYFRQKKALLVLSMALRRHMQSYCPLAGHNNVVKTALRTVP